MPPMHCGDKQPRETLHRDSPESLVDRSVPEAPTTGCEEIRPSKERVVDPTPDERGNLLVMALIDGGRAIALTLNAN